MNAGKHSECPYNGLIPFDIDREPFFFGRTSDRRIIASNLRASRLTLVYGPSGVGKSSILRAAVAKDVTRVDGLEANTADADWSNFIAVTFYEWKGDPIAGLIVRVREVVERVVGKPFTPPSEPNLAKALAWWSETIQGTLLIILDQFEDYFFYHEGEDGPDSFAWQLPQAIRQAQLGANFIISIREESLAKLDRFKGRLPTLFQNTLRVKHLDRPAAEEAVKGPIGSFNGIYGLKGDEEVNVDQTLVEAVLDQVAADADTLNYGSGGRGVLKKEGSGEQAHHSAIETSFLQLVMIAVWNARDQTENPNYLSYKILERLGGTSRIIRTHLDDVLGRLSPRERETAAEVLRYLVTPSGTKIAQTAGDLAVYTKRPLNQVEVVLKKLELSGGNDSDGLDGYPAERAPRTPQRILRRIEGVPGEDSFEIFHDVLAKVILGYLETREAELARRRVRRWAALVGGLLILLVFATGGWLLAWRATNLAKQRFQLAYSIVGKFDTKLTDSSLLNAPGMEPLKKDLMETSINYYKMFIEEVGNDNNLKKEMANAYYWIGLFELAEDRLGSAEEDLKKALSLRKQLVSEYPNDPRLKVVLADTLVAIGRVRHNDRRLDDAAGAFKQAIDQLDRLSLQYPADVSIQKARAAAYTFRSYLDLDLKKYDLAGEDLGKARSAWEELVANHPVDKEHPESLDFAVGLARTLNILGNILLSTGQLSLSIAEFERSRNQWEKVLAVDPYATDARFRLARVFWNLGVAYSLRGSYETARKMLEEAILRWSDLEKGHPSVPIYRSDQAYGSIELGHIDRTTGHLEKARREYGAARLVFEDLLKHGSKDPNDKDGLANTLLWSAISDSVDNREAFNQKIRKTLDIWKELDRGRPNQADYLKGMAQAYLATGNLSKSYELWSKLNDESPRNFEYSLGLAECLDRQGNASRAHELRKVLVDRCPELIQGVVDLAKSEYQAGRLLMNEKKVVNARVSYDRAIEALQGVLARARENAEAKRLLKQARQAREELDSSKR